MGRVKTQTGPERRLHRFRTDSDRSDASDESDLYGLDAPRESADAGHSRFTPTAPQFVPVVTNLWIRRIDPASPTYRSPLGLTEMQSGCSNVAMSPVPS